MIEIMPLDHLDASVAIPGSKSYTHRALIVSALADGASILINGLRCEDTNHTIRALKKFGVPILCKEDGLHVQGRGGKLAASEERIFVGSSGTSMRFLTAVAALKKGRTLLDGSVRMRKRPIAQLLDGLVALGVNAYSKERNGLPPVVIESQGIKGGWVRINGSESSQFLSAVLLVAPYANEDVRVEVTGPLVSKHYIDITLDVMRAFGVEVESGGYRSFFVRAGQRYAGKKFEIEGDASNASYFFGAAAVARGRVRVENLRLPSFQGDMGFLDILKRMGCGVIRGENWAEVHGKELQGIEVDMNAMPDLVPMLAVTAAFARGRTAIRNIGHLRLKESDRIRTLARELSRMGIRVEEEEDGLKIEGGKARGAEIETYHDHRLAMSFAVAGLAVPGIKIKGEGCVNKSFPDFWKTLGRLYP